MRSYDLSCESPPDAVMSGPLRSQLAQFLPEQSRGLSRPAKRFQARPPARVLGKTLDYFSTQSPIVLGKHH